MRELLITIDGPAGAGKSTISRMLADRLDYRYIDTGALYRAVALAADRIKLSGDEEDAVFEDLCRGLRIEFVREDQPAEKQTRLMLDREDITDQIRTPELTMLASKVSAKGPVRKFLLEVQRALGREKAAVFEGRDMGTVVFPEADLKFFLDASPEARARRRYEELKPFRSDLTCDMVLEEINRRDQNDSSRALSPLKPAVDAILIDSTALSPAGVVEKMLSFF